MCVECSSEENENLVLRGRQVAIRSGSGRQVAVRSGRGRQVAIRSRGRPRKYHGTGRVGRPPKYYMQTDRGREQHVSDERSKGLRGGASKSRVHVPVQDFKTNYKIAKLINGKIYSLIGA